MDGERAVPYIRPNIKAIPYWDPTGALPSERTGRVHRMDLNECPYPPSDRVVAAMRDHADKVNRYPEGGCPRLTERISERTGVPAANIAWGTGSTELLSNIVRIAIAPGDELVSPAPMWRRFVGVYQITDADVRYVPNRPDCGIDVAGLAGAVGNRTRLVICVTPNNPTGLMVTADELRLLARQVPDNVLLYVDEAYQEFAVHAGGPDALEILKDRRGPWVVTRTFSKAYALAGLRLGYALCSSEAIAAALRAVTSTFNVSAFGEVAALAALDDPDYTVFILEKTAQERARLIDGLREVGLEPLPSVTNFVSARRDGLDASKVVAAMRQRGVRIAGWGDPDFPDYIRISVGLPEDTDACLATLNDVLDEMG